MGTYQNLPRLPFSPGLELAGTVTETTSSHFDVGDRVVATVEHRAYQVSGERSKH